MPTALDPDRRAHLKTGRRALLLLHGLMGDTGNWDATVEYFSDRYFAAAFAFKLYEEDAPYHSVATLSRGVLGEMDRLGVRSGVLFGNSMGGQIALNVALKHPDRVAGMVLCGSAGLFERNMASEAPLNPTREYVRERVREVFYDERHVTDAVVDEVLGILQNIKNKLRLVKLARSLRAQNLYDHLPEINVPVLLIWGRQDAITPVEAARTFADRLPRARIHVLDECGHAPNIEQPDQFNRLAAAFLEEIGYT
jgi:pimeloyl-ACP methyl ester carboxylesterase